jgi:predicted amidohydrolase
VRAAIVQLRVDDAENAADRVTRVAGIVRAQTGVDLVVLPELWVPGAFAYSSFEASASTLPGPAVSAIAAAAREIGSYVLAGTFIEIDGDRLHNTAVLLDPQGAISRVYRKVHLFGFDHGEAATLTAGADVSTFALGDLATMAMTTSGSPSCTGCSWTAAPSSSWCRRGGRPPGWTTGCSCCGPGQSRTSSS